MQVAKVTQFAVLSCRNLIHQLNWEGGLYRIFIKKENVFEQMEFKQSIHHAWNERNLDRWWKNNRSIIFWNLEWMSNNKLPIADFQALPLKKNRSQRFRNKNEISKWKCNLAIFNHSFLEICYVLLIVPNQYITSKSKITSIVKKYSKLKPDLSDSDKFIMPSELTKEDSSNMSVGNIIRLTHDLRKPLANLMMNHEKLGDILDLSDEEIKNNPDILKSALKRFGLQLKQMESFTWDILHIGTGSIPKENKLQEFSFRDLLKDILLGFEDSFRIHKIKINLDLKNNFIITQNKVLIHRIIYNLVSNAWQHCSTPGTIYLDVTTRGNWMKLDIEDSGKTLLIEDETFELSQKNIGRGGGGWGIGLASSMKMATELGGRLKHRPSIYGKGVHFLLVLPDKK